MADASGSPGGITIPQLAAAAIIGYFVLRWIFNPSSSSSSSTNTRAAAAPRQPRNPNEQRRLRQQVEVLKGMFPQFSEAAIEAELLRNGMNIEVATDRILTTGFLPEPPRPAAASSSNATSSAAASSSSSATQRRTPAPAPAAAPEAGPSKITSQYPDLITRYNLHHRLNEVPPPASSPSPSSKGKAPATKADRQMAHKAKRDEMVLEARRTVEKMIKEGRHPV